MIFDDSKGHSTVKLKGQAVKQHIVTRPEDLNRQRQCCDNFRSCIPDTYLDQLAEPHSQLTELCWLILDSE